MGGEAWAENVHIRASVERLERINKTGGSPSDNECGKPIILRFMESSQPVSFRYG